MVAARVPSELIGISRNKSGKFQRHTLNQLCSKAVEQMQLQMQLPGVFDMPTIKNGSRSNEDLRKSYRLTSEPPPQVLRAEY